MIEEERIAGTPLIVGMERPESSVLAEPRDVVRRLGLLSFLLLVTGSLLAWVAARRVSRPLRELTGSTSAVARGDYDTRVDTADYEEVARLAAAFNHMAQEIAVGRRGLEQKTREAQLRQQIITDGHAPDEYRADTVRNMDAWYPAFDVKQGEKLALPPEKRVRVW